MTPFISRHNLLILATATAAVIFSVDLSQELGVATGVLYIIPVCLTFAAGNRRHLWIAATICSLLTIIGCFWSPPGGELWKVLVNRAFALAVIWISAALCARVLRLAFQQVERIEAAEIAAREIAAHREEERRKARIIMSIMEDLRMEREKLVSSERRFRTTIELAPTAMVMYERSGRIVLINHETEKLFGYQRKELLSQPVEILVRENFRRGNSRHQVGLFADHSEQRMGSSLDLKGLRKNGSQFPIEIGLNQIKTDEGEFYLCAIVDVTDRKRAERKIQEAKDALAKSNAELEHFAYIASHDLQEPLRKITSYCELLKEEQGEQLNEDGREYLDIAIKSATRLSTLIRDLLSFSRINTRGKPLTATDANECLQTAIQNLELLIEETGTRVTADPLPTVMADDSQLILLLQNLIANAIKYRSDKNPEVHISGRRDGRKFEFEVRDNGIGIDPEFHDRIFQIFQRLHNRRDFDGNGIGLAFCKRIVERFDGKIWVESAPGEGSAFHFTLKMADQQEAHHVSNGLSTTNSATASIPVRASH